MKKIRLVLGVIILIISLSILIWSFWPTQRETRVLPISPTEMTLPTPQASLFGSFGLYELASGATVAVCKPYPTS